MIIPLMRAGSGPARLAALLSIALWPAAAAAFECTTTMSSEAQGQPGYVSIHWNQRLIPYAIRAPGSTSVDGPTTLELVMQAFDAWQVPRCSDIAFDFKGVVDDSTDPRTLSQVIFIQQGWAEGKRSLQAVALTTMTYGVNDGTIRFGVLEVNEELFQFADASLACTGAAYDLGAVVTHEAGHFIGLAHTQVVPAGRDDPVPTMTAMVDPCDASFRTLAPDDVEGLCFIYPEGETNARQCAELPDQPGPYVSSVPFGCSTTGGESGADWLLLVGLAAATLSQKARRACTWLRSGS